MTEKLSCSNCKYSAPAREISSKWAGLGCKKITTLSNSGDCATYIVPSEEETLLIVSTDFLCVLYESKE